MLAAGAEACGAGAGLTGGLGGGAEAKLNLHLVQTLTKSGREAAQFGQVFMAVV